MQWQSTIFFLLKDLLYFEETYQRNFKYRWLRGLKFNEIRVASVPPSERAFMDYL